MSSTKTPREIRLEASLQAREQTACPRHARYDDDNCLTCRGEYKGSLDNVDDAEWWAAKASRACDRRFPLDYVAAGLGDVDGVTAWAQRCRATPRTSPSLLITGPTAVGKTWQAYAALRHAITQPRHLKWLHMTVVDFLAQLRAAPTQTGERYRLMRTFQTTDLLLLDDLGAETASAWTEETLWALVDHRCKEHLPMIITTNLGPDDLAARVGDRIDSRLYAMCRLVEMTGEARRESPEPTS